MASLAAAGAKERARAPLAGAQTWLGEEMPLPLAVRTPEDLQFKAEAERQYLRFNLFAGGKLAFDSGDFATAAARLEALLALLNLPPEVEATARPFAQRARARAGAAGPETTAAPKGAPEPQSAPPKPPERPAVAALQGVVAGGGALGPGGTVIVLRRLGAATPRPRPATGKVIVQRGKTFVPRVLAVPVGTAVEFLNEDEISHNVFSLSKPNDFDLGLYKRGLARSKQFDTPGPVQLLCNIHTSMVGYVFVADSPWFAQADSSGAFAIRGVPPGEYQLEAWHEAAGSVTRQNVRIEGDLKVALTVGGDKSQPAFVPDKYGKPRQVQLGY